MSPAPLARPSDTPTPWTAEAMRQLYRQSQWTRFWANCQRDHLLFADLVVQGMGTFEVQVIDGRPVSVFTMAPHWVRGLEAELEAERAAKEGA